MTVDKEAEKTAKKKLICYTRFTLKLFHNGKATYMFSGAAKIT